MVAMSPNTTRYTLQVFRTPKPKIPAPRAFIAFPQASRNLFTTPHTVDLYSHAEIQVYTYTSFSPPPFEEKKGNPRPFYTHNHIVNTTANPHRDARSFFTLRSFDSNNLLLLLHHTVVNSDVSPSLSCFPGDIIEKGATRTRVRIR